MKLNWFEFIMQALFSFLVSPGFSGSIIVYIWPLDNKASTNGLDHNNFDWPDKLYHHFKYFIC